MASETLNKYIEKRYDRWMDYAKYHCGLAGIPDEAADVLNEVLCMLLQKPEQLLDRLIGMKRNGYTELDFFVLKMIKLNSSSPTSPYQSRYRSIPVDDNVDYTRLDIEDLFEEQQDGNQLVDQFHQVREAFDYLELSPLASRVFEFHFFQDQQFSDWEGPETLKQLYEIYNGVQELIRKKISGEFIF